MPRPLRKQFAGAKYHVCARGNGRRTIFHTDTDRSRFMTQLQEAMERDNVILFAYVLMPNHYHLMIETPRGNLCQFTHRLHTAYSMYYRYKHDHPGSVLQQRCKAPLVEGDDYLLRLTRYIHLNPVKTRRMETCDPKRRARYLVDYKWSSCQGYVDIGQEEPFVDYRWRELIGGRKPARQRRRYLEYLGSMIDDDDDELIDAISASDYALGDESFVTAVEKEIRGRGKSIVRSDVIMPSDPRTSIQRINAAVCRRYGCRPGTLQRHGHCAGEAKRVAIELACRLSGLNQREVGGAYGGIGGGAVSHQRRMLRSLLETQPDTARHFEALLDRLTR